MPVCQRCLRRCPTQCDRARGAQLHWDPRMLWRWDHRSLRRGQTRGWQQDLASGLLVGLAPGQKRMWQTKGRGKVTKTWAKHEGGACASRILRDRLILELPENAVITTSCLQDRGRPETALKLRRRVLLNPPGKAITVPYPRKSRGWEG